jgi:pimeloyl-ACP methyl ester carboxylesterase
VGASSELRELGRLAGTELAAAVGGIERMHRGIAARAFRFTPGARPVQIAHDALSAGVYRGIASGFRAAGIGAARALPERSVSDTPRGAVALGVLNGLIGDSLASQGSPLALGTTAHIDGPETPDVVVFLHGLMETEHGWRLGGRPSYGDRLRDAHGWTPVYVTYNTGRHISENGRDLDLMLDQLIEEWPVPVARIALVGHSMGGLVARSACCHGDERDAAWVRRVRHTVSLGTPHLGAPLANLVHYADLALHKLPETRPFGAFLRRRSSGIRDLRNGSLVDEDWSGRDPHALRAAACREVPLLPGATHHFVSATITRSAAHPLGRLVGDWLVLSPSSSGASKTRRVGFEDGSGHVLGGVSHIALLNHDEVYERLEDWIGRTSSRALTR